MDFVKTLWNGYNRITHIRLEPFDEPPLIAYARRIFHKDLQLIHKKIHSSTLKVEMNSSFS